MSRAGTPQVRNSVLSRTSYSASMVNYSVLPLDGAIRSLTDTKRAVSGSPEAETSAKVP